MKIGFRTIKTAIATGLSIAVAGALGLEFYSFAGILCIMCLRETVKRSFRDAVSRLTACVIGMIYGVIIFSLFGYHPWSITVLLLLLIPTTVLFKVQGSVVTACVIVLHMYILQHADLKTVLNELQLIGVGIGFALLMNSYMPSLERELISYQKKIDDNYRKIFREIAVYVRRGESDWDGAEIIETEKMLDEAQDLARRDIENQILREEHRYLEYFLMRGEQFEIIERIMMLISTLQGSYRQGQEVADYLEELAAAISPSNNVAVLLNKLESLQEDFRQHALPQDREEFENRAILMHFVHDMERYLHVKKKYISQE